MEQISDEATLEKIILEVIANNPGAVEDYRNGKKKATGFLVGQVMQATRGQANPALVNQILARKLNS
jgi:aspartyl-tRNA(Asn)/glutamyl-tRNA(Gln) amidotransferase subunit B